MSHTKMFARVGIAAMALGALVTGATSAPAHADPTPAGTYRTYAAVGSDTTQAVWNGLTNGTGTLKNIGSYDATGSATIQTKATGASFVRPVGSGNGVKALSAVWDPNYPSHDWMGATLANDEVDFARSSSGPATGTGLTYLPFARDAVSVAIKQYSSGTSIKNFTTAQLAAIYGGPDDNTAGTGVTYDATTGLPKFVGHVLHPLLPQSGSGTRKFFQGAINIPDSDLASYVDPNSSVIENNGTYLTQAGNLVPFSAAQWIAQGNGAQTNTTSGDSMTNINSKTPFTGTAPSLTSGTLFGTKVNNAYTTPPVAGPGVFARDTYNVVPTLFFSGTAAQQALITELTGSAPKQLGSGTSKATIRNFGFGVLTYFGDSSYYLDGIWQH